VNPTTYMATKRWLSQALLVAFFALPFTAFSDSAAIQREIDLIREQNQVLQQQIKTLSDKVGVLESNRTNSKPQYKYPANGKTNAAAFPIVKIGAEGGLGFAYSDSYDGTSTFFIDDVKLSLAAQLTKKIDFFADVNLNTLNFHPPGYPLYAPDFNRNVSLNEIHLDFRDVLEPFGYDNWLNVRAGQFYIPFGEEYAVRYAFDNPLIWRSVSDIWGLSPGVEIYGSSGKWSYIVAVQNRGGGSEGIDADKSLTGKIRFDANDHFYISASAMRTGTLIDGSTSALWLNGYPAFAYASSNYFFFANQYAHQADLFELDAQLKWTTGYLKVWGGFVLLDQGGSEQNDEYYSVEALQHLTPKLYAVARVSQFFERYFDDLRLSGGLGYQFNHHVVLKTDVTDDFYSGHSYGLTVGGELAFRF
jgi:hypothetical protein